MLTGGHRPGTSRKMLVTTASAPSHKQYARIKVLNDHLVRFARNMPHEPAQRGGTGSLSDGLTYASAIHVPEYARGNCGARQDATPTETDGYDLSLHTSSSAILPGGLSEADLNRFGGSPLLVSSIRHTSE